MERISEDRERNFVLLHQSEQFPEIRVQDRIATRDVEVREAVVHLTEVKAIIKGVLHLLPRHRIQLFAVIL